MSKTWPALLLVVAVALTGCTMDAPAEPVSRSTFTPKQRPTSTGAAVVASDLVVATGTFASATTPVTGGIVVKQTGGSYTAYFTDYTIGDTAQATIAFSGDDIGLDDCVSDRYSFAFSPNGLGPDGAMPLFFRPEAADLSYLETVVIARYPTSAPEEGVCYEPTLAVAALEWTLPDPFPDLPAAVDSGPVPAASGLSWTEDGHVLSYRTAPNDKFATIAARFGLSEAELAYLNPDRPGQYKAGLAYVDEILNLVRAGR